ncbi:MAG: polysaccharide deacetylase family protein [Chloroflexi bacterium]|nr:polysaccharide deacetylase family protein [Chloroflexota bacterium]
MSMARCLKPSLFLLVIVMISGCNRPDNPVTLPYVPTGAFTLTPILPTPVLSTDTLLPPPTATATSTTTATAIATVTATPTPIWVFQSGTITCPILLYHRIADPPSPDWLAARYYTSPADFEWQMQVLKDWGYTTIPISLLVDAIMKGALLPPRPVVISFDDGYENVYENAYPVMQVQAFTGVMYLIVDAVGSQGYMDVGQIQEMTANGWEIGSHSMTHPHLPAVHDQINYEAGQSKGRLKTEIGVSVETFAYPYGEIDPFVVSKVAEYGYLAAVGLWNPGHRYVHSLDTLYYLSRIEVVNGVDQAAFAALLPWSGQP